MLTLCVVARYFLNLISQLINTFLWWRSSDSALHCGLRFFTMKTICCKDSTLIWTSVQWPWSSWCLNACDSHNCQRPCDIVNSSFFNQKKNVTRGNTPEPRTGPEWVTVSMSVSLCGSVFLCVPDQVCQGTFLQSHSQWTFLSCLQNSLVKEQLMTMGAYHWNILCMYLCAYLKKNIGLMRPLCHVLPYIAPVSPVRSYIHSLMAVLQQRCTPGKLPL